MVSLLSHFLLFLFLLLPFLSATNFNRYQHRPPQKRLDALTLTYINVVFMGQQCREYEKRTGTGTATATKSTVVRGAVSTFNIFGKRPACARKSASLYSADSCVGEKKTCDAMSHCSTVVRMVPKSTTIFRG